VVLIKIKQRLISLYLIVGSVQSQLVLAIDAEVVWAGRLRGGEKEKSSHEMESFMAGLSG